jgi:hypothetical protein
MAANVVEQHFHLASFKKSSIDYLDKPICHACAPIINSLSSFLVAQLAERGNH